MKIQYILPLTSLFFVGCKSATNPQKELTGVNEVNSVIQPIKGLELKPEVFTVDAQEPSVVQIPGGSTITFPANAFVDEAGNPVKGEVQVKWNEYHSLSDIMLSGIPMKYDSAGVKFDFISGGMFTISAEQKGEELKLAEGKKATIDIASLNDTPCMNFYEMDTQTGRWDYKLTKQAAIPENEKPVTTVSKEESASSSKILDVQMELNNYPELQKKEIVGWKLNGSLSKREDKLLSRRTVKAKLVRDVGNGVYEMEIEIGDYKKILNVEPYLMEEALVNSRKIEQKIEKESEELISFNEKVAEGKIVRSIEIDGFGTYNWDIVCSRSNPKKLIADFDFPEKINPELVSLFLISPDENCVVKYNPQDYELFSFDPNMKNCIVAILPDNSVVSCNNSEFEKAKKMKNDSEFTFTLKRTGISLSSPKDLANYLDKLI